MMNKMAAQADSLAVRVSLILALALLPIGIIAIAQTMALLKESRAQNEAALLALTSEAAAVEEGMLRTALGATEAVAALAPTLSQTPELCHELVGKLRDEEGSFSFVGYVSPEGKTTCSSAGSEVDVSDLPVFKQQMDDPRIRATVNVNAPISKTSVVIISKPAFTEAGEFNGYAAVSLPHTRLFEKFEELASGRPVDLVTFNVDGEPLSSERGLSHIADGLPEGRDLRSFAFGGNRAFTAMTINGERRVFAVVPIIPDLIYGIGSWDADDLGLTWKRIWTTAPLLFPVIMWLASLTVAYVAIQRQVIRPTRNLRARMLLFMRSRQFATLENVRPRPAREFREIDETWALMAKSILHDEAELEDTLHDKTVLLREVHHRVKNNLQLISSIVSMKIRRAKTDDARRALGDVQTRVMGLATVHRNLYETSLQGRVRADELLRSIVQNVLTAGRQGEAKIEVEEHFDRVVLYPDQAVPLSLVVSEALSNAMKYAGCQKGGSVEMGVLLRKDPNSTKAVLEVTNSKGPLLLTLGAQDGTGLGNQLIGAFTSQLEGENEVIETDSRYTLRVSFDVADFTEDEPET
ncbi:sensor histidine kinase [Celeribacter arenosi]|uniref:histidine kinase n=1 Tax=Celeribacter arenosi TaxID=792649 RepID=A0ABP7JS36_9RHOB